MESRRGAGELPKVEPRFPIAGLFAGEVLIARSRPEVIGRSGRFRFKGSRRVVGVDPGLPLRTLSGRRGERTGESWRSWRLSGSRRFTEVFAGRSFDGSTR